MRGIAVISQTPCQDIRSLTCRGVVVAPHMLGVHRVTPTVRDNGRVWNHRRNRGHVQIVRQVDDRLFPFGVSIQSTGRGGKGETFAIC